MAFDIGVRFGLNALDWTMNCCERQIDVFAKRQMRVIAQNISSPGMTPEGAVGRCDRLPPRRGNGGREARLRFTNRTYWQANTMTPLISPVFVSFVP
ncbi:hypothetical protein LMG24076_02432 [Trinickia soli]|nr:hypothetical protein LMG24076_02432 [Trinickia soli]